MDMPAQETVPVRRDAGDGEQHPGMGKTAEFSAPADDPGGKYRIESGQRRQDGVSGMIDGYPPPSGRFLSAQEGQFFQQRNCTACSGSDAANPGQLCPPFFADPGQQGKLCGRLEAAQTVPQREEPFSQPGRPTVMAQDGLQPRRAEPVEIRNNMRGSAGAGECAKRYKQPYGQDAPIHAGSGGSRGSRRTVPG